MFVRQLLSSTDSSKLRRLSSPTNNLVKAGLSQGSVLGPVLYLLYIADVPLTNDICRWYCNPVYRCRSDKIFWKTTTPSQPVTKLARAMENQSLSCQIDINSVHNILIKPQLKCLRLHLDQELTWRSHTKVKNMYWLINPNSQLSLELIQGNTQAHLDIRL